MPNRNRGATVPSLVYAFMIVMVPRGIGMRDDRDQTALSYFLGTGMVDPVNGAA